MRMSVSFLANFKTSIMTTKWILHCTFITIMLQMTIEILGDHEFECRRIVPEVLSYFPQFLLINYAVSASISSDNRIQNNVQFNLYQS
jgi:hypothetical protein